MCVTKSGCSQQRIGVDEQPHTFRLRGGRRPSVVAIVKPVVVRITEVLAVVPAVVVAVIIVAIVTVVVTATAIARPCGISGLTKGT